MRQRGERGYREDWRERGRSFGGHRPGIGGRGDWEQRDQWQNRPYDEDYDELQSRSSGEYGREYGREWNEGDRERGGFDDQSLDEGRFQQYGHGVGRAGVSSRDARFGQRQQDAQRYTPGRSGSEQGWYGGQSDYGDASRQEGTGGYRGSQERFRSSGRSSGQSYGGRPFDQGGYGENRTGDRHFGGIFPQDSHAGKGPQGYRRSDERIRDDVCDCLTDHPEIDPSNIDVKVENCTVTLSGTVDSRAAKRLAEDIAEGIGGVQDVRNELRVQREQNQGEQSSTAFGTRHGNESTRQRQGK